MLVKCFFDNISIQNVLVIMDAGFYDSKNLEIYSQNENKFLLPILMNIKEYKDAVANLNYTITFFYESESKKYKNLVTCFEIKKDKY